MRNAVRLCGCWLSVVPPEVVHGSAEDGEGHQGQNCLKRGSQHSNPNGERTVLDEETYSEDDKQEFPDQKGSLWVIEKEMPQLRGLGNYKVERKSIAAETRSPHK